MAGHEEVLSCPAFRRQRGDGWLTLIVGLAVVLLLSLVLWAVFSGSAERDVEKLVESNRLEMLQLGQFIRDSFDQVEELANHWDVMTIRKQTTVVSSHFDNLFQQASKIREDRDSEEEYATIEDLLSRSLLLQEKIRELLVTSGQHLMVLQLARQLTANAVQVMEALQSEFDAIRVELEKMGTNEIFATRFELLRVSLVQQKSLFSRGIGALMDSDPNGKVVAEAAVNKVSELQGETHAFLMELRAEPKGQ